METTHDSGPAHSHYLNWVKNPKIPSLPYSGGKGRLAKTIIKFLPTSGRLFVEPCAGRGNIFFAVASELQYEQHWLNDTATAPFFGAVRRIGSEIIIPERTRDLYYEMWEAAKIGDDAAAILEPYLSRSGSGYGKGGFCSGNGPTKSGYEQTIRNIHRLLTMTDTRVTSLDALKLLGRLDSDAVVYIDAPYKNCDVRGYKNTFPHEEMVELLSNAPFRWLMSEYEHRIYEPLGPPCWKQEIQMCEAGGRGKRVECLWKNF